jgi:hypothetical protein
MKNKTFLLAASGVALLAACGGQEQMPTFDAPQTTLTTIGNPFIPLWDHIPDGEPYVFEDPDNPGKFRVYVYGSHDIEIKNYCGRDQVVWSADVNDLNHWRMDGVIRKVDKNGKPITEPFNVTRNELMSLYALWNRPAGRLHLENGGGTFINQNGQAFHDNNVVLTDELVKEYTDHLTDQEKEIVDKVVDYMSHEASKWGNDVSMYVYGYRLFNEDSYFPMEVADYANKRSFADPTMPGSGLNPGFTQALTRSKKPLAIRDFFDVVNDHIIGMSNYNAYGAAAHDLDRILNSSLKDGGKETSMIELLRKTYGNSAVNYLKGFVQKLAGTKHNDPSILDTLRTMGYLSGNLY